MWVGFFPKHICDANEDEAICIVSPRKYDVRTYVMTSSTHNHYILAQAVPDPQSFTEVHKCPAFRQTHMIYLAKQIYQAVVLLISRVMLYLRRS